MKRMAWRRWLWRTAWRAVVLSVAALPLAVAVIWLAAHHKPGWYRPAHLDDEGMARVRGQATSVADSVSARIVQAEPFEIALTDRAVTEWLALLPVLAPRVDEAIPRELRRPAVRFEKERIRVAALCEMEGWRGIVSVGLTATMSPDGRSLRFALADVRSGSLPVPRPLLSKLFARFVRDPVAEGRRRWEQGDTELAEVLQPIRRFDDLYGGVEVRNRFIWPNGERLIRIETIEVLEGEMRLRVQPL